MDIIEAFKILKLKTVATAEEIELKFKTLAKKTHPDTGGDYTQMQQLNEARQLALQYVNNKEIFAIAVSHYNDLVKAMNVEAINRQGYRNDGDRIILQISRIQKSKISKQKNNAKLVGIISGTFGLVTSNIIPAFDDYIKVNSVSVIASFSLAFIFGLYYLLLNTQIENIQSMIDDLKEHLDDNETLFNIILSISKNKYEKKEKHYSKQELEKLIENWAEDSYPENYLEIEGMENLKSIKRSILKIGIRDFTKFFIAKSLEKGFVKKEKIRNKELFYWNISL